MTKVRVPDTFQLGAISPFSAFLASQKISKLRVFKAVVHSNSPRLQNILMVYITIMYDSKSFHRTAPSTAMTPLIRPSDFDRSNHVIDPGSNA